MYHLYASPNPYSIGAHLLLEESGVPYRIINPRINPSLTDTAFHNASPHARVPALILPNASTLCESGAIALHLADSLCELKYSIHPDSVYRGRYLQWMFYLSSTLQPDVMLVFHPEFYVSDNATQTALVQSAHNRMLQVWAVLEHEYSDQEHKAPWLFESGPTAVDFSLATVLLWPECFPASSQAYPALRAMLDALSQRASFKRVIPWHQRTTDEPAQRETGES